MNLLSVSGCSARSPSRRSRFPNARALASATTLGRRTEPGHIFPSNARGERADGGDDAAFLLLLLPLTGSRDMRLPMLRGTCSRPRAMALAVCLAAACADTRDYCDQPLSCDVVDASPPRPDEEGKAIDGSHPTLADGGALGNSDGVPDVPAISGTLPGSEVAPIPMPSVVPSGPAAVVDASAPAVGDQDPTGTTIIDASDGDRSRDSAIVDSMNDTDSVSASDAKDAATTIDTEKDVPDAASCSSRTCREWTPPIPVLVEPGGARDAHVAITDDGVGVVVWSPLDELGKFLPQLIARTFDPSTGAWGDAVTVAEDNFGAPFEVFASDSESFVVIWKNAEGNEVQSRHFDGTTWNAPTTLVLETAGFHVASNADHAVVGWCDYDEDEELYHVRTRTWNSANNAWEPRVLVQTTGLQASDVFTAIGEDGSAFVVWHELPEGEPEVWASRMGPGDADWSTPHQLGTSIVHQTGSDLVVNRRGDLIARWIGRFQGALWDNVGKSWSEIDTQVPWSDAKLCTLGDDNAIMIERDSDGSLWSQRWSSDSAQLEPRTQLAEISKEPLFLACNNGVGVAAWNDRVRIWISAEQQWTPEHRFDAGVVLGAAVSANGSALVARGIVSDSGDRYADLNVEHFE